MQCKSLLVTHIFITFNLQPLCPYVPIGNKMRIKLTQHTTYPRSQWPIHSLPRSYTICLVISVAMFVKAVLCTVASSTELTSEHTHRDAVLVTYMSTQTSSGTQ
jgi:hypothetical protein